MELFIYILIVVIAIGSLAGFLFWFIRKELHGRNHSGEDAYNKSLVLLQNQIQNLAQSVDTKLSESRHDMETAVRTQFSESQNLLRDFSDRLSHFSREITEYKETNKQIFNITEQLQTLQNTLQNPKQRGVLGEYYLETVLKNMFSPERFALQYKIGVSNDGNNLIADAVIFLEKNKILPIDSKFSLENYNRLIQEKNKIERDRLEKLFIQDTKNRINETAKYIRPKDGTMDFAFMFIPSEAIYYDLLIGKVGSADASLIEYAFREKHVIIVSPTSFMAYLQTVLQGLRALQIEESAKEIQKRVEELGRHIGNYDQYMAKLGNSLSTTVNHYNTAHKELKKIDKDVLRVTGDSAKIEPIVIDRPQVEE